MIIDVLLDSIPNASELKEGAHAHLDVVCVCVYTCTQMDFLLSGSRSDIWIMHGMQIRSWRAIISFFSKRST